MIRLGYQYGEESITFAEDQSALCPSRQQCSAMADTSMSPFRAHQDLTKSAVRAKPNLDIHPLQQPTDGFRYTLDVREGDGSEWIWSRLMYTWSTGRETPLCYLIDETGGVAIASQGMVHM